VAITITNESKNSVTITNENKPSGETWDSDPARTWDDEGTWDVPGLVIHKESKNSLTISNETKT
jgi:hypothetical protein